MGCLHLVTFVNNKGVIYINCLERKHPFLVHKGEWNLHKSLHKLSGLSIKIFQVLPDTTSIQYSVQHMMDGV